MTFYEKLVEKAKEMGFSSMTKFFDTAEVNTNARQALKKTGRLSDTYKMRIARVLKCSVGDINRMMSEAQADALKKDWPDKAKCSPTKNEVAKNELAKNDGAKTEATEAETVKLREEEAIGEYAPSEPKVVKCEGPSHFDTAYESAPAPEPEPVPEVTHAQTEDDVADAKINEIKAQADSMLTYHDRIKEAAKAVLAKEYADMLRKQMLFVAVADLTDLCREFTENPDPNRAVAFMDVAGEIMKLKEEK